MLRRCSSRPLVEKEWVRVAPLSSCTLAKAWRPSIVTVQLVTMMSWPSKLVLVMPMAVSLVKVIALAVGTPMIRSIGRVNQRNGCNDVFIAITAECRRGVIRAVGIRPQASFSALMVYLHLTDEFGQC